MRRKVTLNLDEEWLNKVDGWRGSIPRSRFVEEHFVLQVAGTVTTHREEELIRCPPERSPEPEASSELSREAPKPPKAERLQRARSVLSRPVQPRPLVQKRGK